MLTYCWDLLLEEYVWYAQVASDPKAYKALLVQLIVQGILKLQSGNVAVRCREVRTKNGWEITSVDFKLTRTVFHIGERGSYR